jgi:hypothetical protein
MGRKAKEKVELMTVEDHDEKRSIVVTEFVILVSNMYVDQR